MELFSAEWADALTAALNADEDFQRASRKRNHDVVTFRVTGPEGELVYHMLIHEGEAQIGLGKPANTPTCTITMDIDTAKKLATGELSGQQASMTGRLTSDLPPAKAMSLGPVLDARQHVETGLNLDL